MAASSASDEPIVAINVTPLVDIVLVLLVVFMVTAKLIVSDVLPLDLPRASTGGAQQTVLAIELGADGQTVVNRSVVADDEGVFAAAQQARAADVEVRAVIKADGAVPHRRVVAVMDALRRAKIEKIAFGVVEPVQLGKGQ